MDKVIEQEFRGIGKIIESLDMEEGLPEEILKISEQEILGLKIPFKVNILPNDEFKVIVINLSDSVKEVMNIIAQEFHQKLLPPEPEQPLDQLFYYDRHNNIMGPIVDLAAPIWRVITQHHARLKLSLKLSLSIQVNANWKIAPKEEMTPRAILQLFDLDAAQYSLYHLDGSEPLPIDTLVKLHRGERFVALKDGKYGDK
ncbi:MAG: hypothetical protein HQL12_02960 [Candidatus Omnitrophica bacterium]|nr:hypothetical protein [Candidatus Omnitrophota bacterium]